jgi:hypothetical protein
MPAIESVHADMTWLLRSESRRTPKTDRVGRVGMDDMMEMVRQAHQSRPLCVEIP